jgi:hypothetical protein
VIKNAQQSVIEDGVTATMVAIPTKEGRRRCGAGRATMRRRKQSGSSRSLPQCCQFKGKERSAKEVEEGHSGRTPASGIGQGKREHWAMVVEDGERWWSTEVSAADASGQQWMLTKYSALEER